MIYQYRCGEGHLFDVEQKITDDPVKQCKVCRAPAQRVIHPTPFVLKGGGWSKSGYSKEKK